MPDMAAPAVLQHPCDRQRRLTGMISHESALIRAEPRQRSHEVRHRYFFNTFSIS